MKHDKKTEIAAHGAPDGPGVDPALPDDECCGRCRFVGPAYDLGGVTNIEGQCRRYPPHLQKSTLAAKWAGPPVRLDGWCGEYELRDRTLEEKIRMFQQMREARS